MEKQRFRFKANQMSPVNTKKQRIDMIRKISLSFPPLIRVFMLKRSQWTVLQEICHCVKSVQILSFLRFVFSRIRTEYGDLQSKIYRVSSQAAGLQLRWKGFLHRYFSRNLSKSTEQQYWRTTFYRTLLL